MIECCGKKSLLKENMTNKIKQRLKIIFDQKSYSEQDVVYCLVEIYKLLEIEGKLNKFKVIRFYRNWVCHSHLSKDAGKIFEEVYILIRARKYFKGVRRGLRWVDLVEHAIESSFKKFSLPTLEKELLNFLKSFLKLREDKLLWDKFRYELYKIITDIPLKIMVGESEIFSFVCKKISNGISNGDLEIEVKAGGNSFNFSIDDEFLEIS